MIGRALDRWHNWIARERWTPIVWILIGWHAAITVLYLVGRAVSAVPFTDHAARSVVSSPAIPIAHLAAALLLAAALCWPGLRGAGAVASWVVWCGYTVAVGAAAQLRVPQLALVSPVLALGIAVLAGYVVIGWTAGDDDGTV